MKSHHKTSLISINELSSPTDVHTRVGHLQHTAFYIFAILPYILFLHICPLLPYLFNISSLIWSPEPTVVYLTASLSKLSKEIVFFPSYLCSFNLSCRASMRRIQELKAIYYFLYSVKDSQEQIYCHLFNISPNLPHTFDTLVHALSDATCEECFWLHVKPYVHHILDLFPV